MLGAGHIFVKEICQANLLQGAGERGIISFRAVKGKSYYHGKPVYKDRLL
jgi:hypothetical protein